MRTYHYVECSFPEPFLDIRYFLCRSQPAYEIDVAREILQPSLERIIMLQGKNCGRHKDCNLLAVGYSLECSPYSNLCLSETYIAAYKPVHRAVILHVMLHSFHSLLLVGSILVHE